MNKNYENWFLLQEGMLIRAKRDLRSHTRNWNNPKNSTLAKNTLLMVPSEATRYGDLGPRGVGIVDAEGNFTCGSDSRGYVVFFNDFLSEGYKSRVGGLGLADPECFEIVGQLEGKLHEFYCCQAPHITKMFKINPLVLIQREGEFTFDEGYWNKETGWALCYDPNRPRINTITRLQFYM